MQPSAGAPQPMKDYNLRSRDIYGDPRPKVPRILGKLALLLILGGAGAAGYWYWHSSAPATGDVAVPKPMAATPDIIPLVLPPRRDSAAPTAGEKPAAAGR
jgi:hypothetical protein